MRYITFILLFASFGLFAQNDYELISDTDSTLLLKTISELGNGNNAVSFEPAANSLDSAEMLKYIVNKTIEQKAYAANAVRRKIEFEVQANRLQRLVNVDLDSNYYHTTWDTFGDNFVGDYRIRVDGVFYDAEMFLNKVDRLICRVDGNVFPVLIESNRSFRLTNSTLLDNVTYYAYKSDSRRIIYRSDEGADVFVRIK